MTLNLSTKSVLAASVASAHLANLAIDSTMFNNEAQAAVFKMSWNMVYGFNRHYGIELTLMNGDKLNIGYATLDEQQQDWLKVQAAAPYFGKVLKSTASSTKKPTTTKPNKNRK